MELNEEAVKKSLDWLDSLVGNSNDSDIALLTYQLLGILYDTCEELTEENETLHASCTDLTRKCASLEADVAKEFTCVFGTPHKVSDCPINDEIAKAKADTVQKIQSEIEKRCIKGGIYPAFVASTIDQIAKEMLEGEK